MKEDRGSKLQRMWGVYYSAMMVGVLFALLIVCDEIKLRYNKQEMDLFCKAVVNRNRAMALLARSLTDQ